MPIDLSPAALSRAIGGMDAEQSEPSQKDPRGLFKKVGLPALIGGQGLDLATTLMALHKGGYEEANPILGNSPMKIGLMKGATNRHRLSDAQVPLPARTNHRNPLCRNDPHQPKEQVHVWEPCGDCAARSDRNGGNRKHVEQFRGAVVYRSGFRQRFPEHRLRRIPRE